MVKISLFFISTLLLAISLLNAEEEEVHCGKGHMTDKQIDSVGDAMGKAKIYYPDGDNVQRSFLHGEETWARIECVDLSTDDCRKCVRDLIETIWLKCNYTTSAEIKINGCQVEYKVIKSPNVFN